MNELHLFAGAGGGILGGLLCGHTPVCAVEIDPYCRQVLLQRQRDGMLPRFPVWDDVTTFDGRPWRGRADIVCGGFPCQDISAAGKRRGIEGARSGLWSHMARIIGEVRPRYALVENSPMLVGRGLAVVLGNLAALGYDAVWCVLGARHVGAPHRRDRIWILAYATLSNGETMQNSPRATQETQGEFRGSGGFAGNVSNPQEPRLEGGFAARNPRPDGRAPEHRQRGRAPDWWASEPGLDRVAHGVANRVDRLSAIGNGQVPAVVALAWRTLNQIREETTNGRDTPGPH